MFNEVVLEKDKLCGIKESNVVGNSHKYGKRTNSDRIVNIAIN